MQQNNNLFKPAVLALFAACVFSASNASAKQNSVDFTAIISTEETLIPTTLCSSGFGGVGKGLGKTNLFSVNKNDFTPSVLVTSDCVTPSSAPIPAINNFGPGVFTLMGPGGDSIFAQYSGRLLLTPPTDQTSPIQTYTFDSSTFQIVGGTGRFEKAKGTGTISGTEVINFGNGTSTGSLTATGQVVY